MDLDLSFLDDSEEAVASKNTSVAVDDDGDDFSIDLNIDDDEYEEVKDEEEDPTIDKLSAHINECLENVIKDRSSTPRLACYAIGEKSVKVCIAGPDYFIYHVDPDLIVYSMNTSLHDIPKGIDKSLLVKVLAVILDVNNKKSDTEKRDEALIKKHRVNAKSNKLTEKQFQDIQKYEQRKDGNW